MTGREYPVGTLADITFDNAPGFKRGRGEHNIITKRAMRVDGFWVMDKRGEGLADDQVANPDLQVKIRPLVVIDYEDREQVERLVGAVHHVDPHGIEPHDIDEMQAALREFANPKPPKPGEPTGLGAVVEDTEGTRWIRGRRMANHWHREDGHFGDNAGPWFAWDQFHAVRVLSEGV